MRIGPVKGEGLHVQSSKRRQVLGGEHVHYDEITRGQKRSFPGCLCATGELMPWHGMCILDAFLLFTQVA